MITSSPKLMCSLHQKSVGGAMKVMMRLGQVANIVVTPRVIT